MDGNGRWAQRRGRPRVFGHVRGSTRVRDVVREANRLGVKVLTLYAFSTENWSRPEAERKVLWKLLRKFLLRDAKELHQQNIRLRVIGEMERLDSETRLVLDQVMHQLCSNTGLQLTIALSYGSKRELVNAARAFAQDCLEGRRQADSMSEELMEHYLWTAGFGEFSQVDLFIRTSGEQRVSNFLLWQAAYAELVFTEVCWPDFSSENLMDAVREYSVRERRFGGLTKETNSSSIMAPIKKTKTGIFI